MTSDDLALNTAPGLRGSFWGWGCECERKSGCVCGWTCEWLWVYLQLWEWECGYLWVCNKECISVRKELNKRSQLGTWFLPPHHSAHCTTSLSGYTASRTFTSGCRGRSLWGWWGTALLWETSAEPPEKHCSTWSLHIQSWPNLLLPLKFFQKIKNFRKVLN